MGAGTSVAYMLGGAVILSVAMVVVLLQLPGIASALAGGVAISAESRAIRNGAGTAAKGVGFAAKGVGAAANLGRRAITTGGRATYGYFKGKSNKSV